MRNHILFFALLIVSSTIYSQNSKLRAHKLYPEKASEITDLLKSNLSEHPILRKEIYSFENNNWVKFSEKVYEYNVENNLSKTIENRISPRYDEFTLFYTEDFYYYNLKPSLLKEKISVRYFDWDPTQYSRILYSYDENDSLTQILHQGKVDSTSTWTNGIRFTNIFVSLGRMQEYRFEMWQEDIWVTQFIIDFLNYDGKNNNIETMFRDCYTGECEESSRSFAEYDEQNNRTKLLYQDKLSDGWINYSQNIYEYNENSKIILDLFQHWNSVQNSWDNASRIEYSYDINSNLLSTLNSRWGSSDWVNSQRYSYKYQDEYKIEELYEAFDIEWKNQSKTVYYYEGITDANKNVNVVTEFSLSQNYPNPFNPSTIICYSISERGLIRLKVFDLLGREVTTLVNRVQSVGSYEIEFDANELTSGIYFYSIQAGGFNVTKKMILLR